MTGEGGHRAGGSTGGNNLRLKESDASGDPTPTTLGKAEARRLARANDFPGRKAVLSAARQLLNETRSRCPQRPTPGPPVEFHCAKGRRMVKIDSNGHTSGQMLPVLPPSQKPGAEVAGGFRPRSWVCAGAEAPSSWFLSLPGSTVGAIGREGGSWSRQRRQRQSKKGTLWPTPQSEETGKGQKRTNTGLLPRATIFSLPLSLRNSPRRLLTPQGQQR